MHLYESQMPKPIWLMCNWTCMSGLTYLCFENEMILRNGEIDELWRKIDGLCQIMIYAKLTCAWLLATV